MFSLLSVDEIYQQLKTNSLGLNPSQVNKRLKKYGYNESPSVKKFVADVC